MLRVGRMNFGRLIFLKISNGLIQRIGNIYDSLAKTKQFIKVKSGGKIWLGSEGENVLRILQISRRVIHINTLTMEHRRLPKSPSNRAILVGRRGGGRA